MGYFTTTPAGFDDALKDFDSVREYRVRVNVDTTPVDITTYLDNNSVTIRHREGSGAQADVRLRNSAGTFGEGDYAGATIGIDARIDESDWIAVFYGWVDEKGAHLEIGSGKANKARLQAHTLEKRAGTKHNAELTVLTDWTVCDTGSPSTSIVHELAEMMGLASGDLDVGIIDYECEWISLGKRSPWQEIRDLADLYRATLYIRADGKLRLRSTLFETSPPTLSSEWSFANDDASFAPNIRDLQSPARGEYVPIQCNRGTCEFDAYETLGADKVIWRSVEGFDEITRRISIVLAAGEYWPVADNAAAPADLSYKDPVTGEEIAYATDVITPTVGTYGSGSDIECNGGLVTVVSFNGSTSATKNLPDRSQIILRNNTGSSIAIYKFEIRGTGYRVKANHKVQYQDAAISDEYDFVDASLPGTYAADEDQVHTALQDLVYRGKGGRRRWTFSTYWLPQVQLDARVEFRKPGGSYVTCRVVGYTHREPGGPMLKAETQLEIEEIWSFTPSGTPVPEVKVSGMSRPGPGYEEFSDVESDVAERPTYTELQEGYTEGGGTTTPAAPTIAAQGHFRAVTIQVSRQLNLTNFDHYEIQVSADESSWYSIEQDGSDWKDTLDEVTEFATELFAHTDIPPSGTAAEPEELTLYYRVRQVTKEPTTSSWSATASATITLMTVSDIIANVLTQAKINMSDWMLMDGTGLVGYWSLNDVAQDVVDLQHKDNSGNEHHAIANALLTEADGPAGPCPDLDGASDYLLVTDHADLQFGTGDFSVSLWVSFDDATPAVNEHIIDKRATATQQGFIIMRSSSGYLVFYVANVLGSSWHTIYSDETISNDGWHHVVCMRDSGVMKMYVDGILQADTQANTTSVSSGTFDMSFGARWHGGGAVYTDGKMAHIRMFSRVLSQGEVRWLYQNPAGNVPEMFLAHRIGAGSILAEHLSVLSKDLVNNVSESRHLGGWGLHDEQGRDISGTSHIELVDGTYDGETVKAMQIEADDNWGVRSKSWRVNHDAIYRVSVVAYRSAGSSATFFFGLRAAESAEDAYEAATTLAINGVYCQRWVATTGSRAFSADTDNFYFAATQQPATPTAYMSYIVGANRSVDECPNVQNCSYIAKLEPTTTHVSLRVLRWGAEAGASYDLFFPSAQILGAGTIVAENILAGAITALKMNTDELYSLTMESTNYDAGAAGWRIARDGGAEFQDVEVRGDVYSEHGYEAGAAFYFPGDTFYQPFFE